MGLWSSEVLVIDRQHRIAWQHMLPQEIMALAISPEDAEYFAVATGVLNPVVHLYERTGRLMWVTETSPRCDRTEPGTGEGERLLSYGNTIHGQYLCAFSTARVLGGMDLPYRYTGDREFEGRHCP